MLPPGYVHRSVIARTQDAVRHCPVVEAARAAHGIGRGEHKGRRVLDPAVGCDTVGLELDARAAAAAAIPDRDSTSGKSAIGSRRPPRPEAEGAMKHMGNPRQAMTKQYDRAYFDHWYRRRGIGDARRLARKVALAVAT